MRIKSNLPLGHERDYERNNDDTFHGTNVSIVVESFLRECDDE